MFQVPRWLGGDLIVWLNGAHVFLLHTEFVFAAKSKLYQLREQSLG